MFYFGYAFFGFVLMVGVWGVTWPAVGAVQRGLPLPGDWTWTTIILVDVFIIVLNSYLLTLLVKEASTQLTEDGVRQRRWRGHLFISWAAVRGGKISPGSLQIIGDNATIEFSLYQFKEPQAVLDFVYAHVPPHVRGDTTT